MIGIRCGVLPQRDVANTLDALKVLLYNPVSQGKVFAEAKALLQPAAPAPAAALADQGRDAPRSPSGEAADAEENVPAAAAAAEAS